MQFMNSQIQTEIAYVTKHRDELLAAMDPKQRQERLEYCRKLEEKVNCLKTNKHDWNSNFFSYYILTVGRLATIRSEPETAITINSHEYQTATVE